MFVIACDMPFVTDTAVKMLLDEYLKHGKVTLAYAEERIHPLLGVYPKSILPYVEKQIQEKDYRVMNALKQAGYVTVVLPKEDVSTKNINTVAEYEQLVKL